MEALFALLTLLPLPVWLSMLLFPRTNFTRKTVTSPWPFITLGALSGILLLAALTTLSPAALAISAPALQQSMASGWGFLAVWVHLLALDLFAGVWIFRDSRYWGIPAAPYLLLTLFAGPLGLGFYLWQRTRREPGDPVRTLN